MKGRGLWGADMGGERPLGGQIWGKKAFRGADIGERGLWGGKYGGERPLGGQI